MRYSTEGCVQTCLLRCTLRLQAKFELTIDFFKYSNEHEYSCAYLFIFP